MVNSHCDIVFHLGIPVYEHYDSHSLSEQNLRCDRCDGAFDTRGQLEAHVAAKHEVKCEACGRVFSTLAALRSHERTHQERDLECERCGKRFQSKTLLATHLGRSSLLFSASL